MPFFPVSWTQEVRCDKELTVLKQGKLQDLFSRLIKYYLYFQVQLWLKQLSLKSVIKALISGIHNNKSSREWPASTRTE